MSHAKYLVPFALAFCADQASAEVFTARHVCHTGQTEFAETAVDTRFTTLRAYDVTTMVVATAGTVATIYDRATPPTYNVTPALFRIVATPAGPARLSRLEAKATPGNTIWYIVHGSCSPGDIARVNLFSVIAREL